ncbi:endolytic transglycosylase MltG [Lacticaseibacillus kribbianus]|uniref:endolytic transglycosylase MltG n=1 Tax=Lacticaseibacillus kribbianus TaxID=2926292 RepID=UPI001CD4CC87|nr:endolytic transglycosylase MltG [Lacticaseibacillus kribbianus]
MDNSPKDNQQRTRDQQVARASQHIVGWVVGVVATLTVIVGLMAALYVRRALQPLDETDHTKIAVTVPVGASTGDIGELLAKKGVIQSALIFKFYVKFHNVPSFQAGPYQFTKADTFDDILTSLRGGADSDVTVGKVLVAEGVRAEAVGDQIAKLAKKNPSMTKAAFLTTLKDDAFFNSLVKKYPQLLKSAQTAEGVRYRLEGYLFPATYDVGSKTTMATLVTQMVAKTDEVMKPYFATIKEKGYSVQEVMTLASLLEREGSNDAARRKIAGVFLNRLALKMPLQSDVSVTYALNTYKTVLTNKDTSVDSPYNLYKHTGYGPGPFNQPSEAAIRAVLSPTDRASNYLYFVANLKTGEILYARTLAEQNINLAKFADDNNSAK